MALTRARKRAMGIQQHSVSNKKNKQSHVNISSSTKAPKTSTQSSPISHGPLDLRKKADSPAADWAPIAHWALKGTWPFTTGDRGPISSILAKKKFLASRMESDCNSRSSDAEYHAQTLQRLKQYRSFMETSELGIADESQNLCNTLHNSNQELPPNSLFGDDVFRETCRRAANKNKATTLRDISPLIVPSVEVHASFRPGSGLECLIESVGEEWENSQPVIDDRPCPDYSAGFSRTTFTKEQLNKIAPVIGDFLEGDQSVFMATSEMYFPFLTCEVKCGTEPLQFADIQNTHSMTLAVRAIVELFRLVGREIELHRQILAFSVSHNHGDIQIYGHYAVIFKTPAKVHYHRHQIRSFKHYGRKW